ncbi:BadF/BadG/BcrA/BcrD ATPase family protein [Pseudoalteromonas sp. SSDWG2]|uniref:BadF/BadG/BcrA/BcrD ATPase family protein n=1 Tax=Pseudoalteromonas sp. SSDWG2 TaxID=3139391 RepID=UPI003BA9461C
MTKWVLAVDGGGTKTALRLYNPEGCIVEQSQGAGSSLSYDLSASCHSIISQSEALLTRANVNVNDAEIVVGVAGATNLEARNVLQEKLQQCGFTHVLVVSDALTSAYGANLGEPVACVAIGTGSVGMRLLADGSTHLVGGWGFLLGDEGSGARLGALLIQALMSAIDSAWPITGVLGALVECIGSDRASINQWVANASVADFAQLSELPWQYHGQCQYADDVLSKHIQAVEALIKRTRANFDLPVVLLGGLAHNTAPLLSRECQQMVQPAKGFALDGAYMLAKSKNRWN